MKKRPQQDSYSKQYRAWVESLTPKERQTLAAKGLDQPDPESYNVGKGQDPTDWRTLAGPAEPTPDPASTVESPAAEAVRRLVVELVDSIRRNPAMTIECLALISGLAYEGQSQAAIAKRYGVTRAAVNKQCVRLAKTLGLPPSRSQRQLTVRGKYGRRAFSIHRRHDPRHPAS